MYYTVFAVIVKIINQLLKRECVYESVVQVDNVLCDFQGIGGNVTTLESALHGFAHAGELKPLRKQLYPTPLPRSKFRLQMK